MATASTGQATDSGRSAEARTQVLRLAATSGVGELRAEEFGRAATALQHLSCDDHLYLWRSPARAGLMARLLEVALRRADAATDEGLSGLALAGCMSRSFNSILGFYRAAPRPSPADMHRFSEEVRPTCLAVVRSGVLHGLSRLVARNIGEREFIPFLAATSAQLVLSLLEPFRFRGAEGSQQRGMERRDALNEGMREVLAAVAHSRLLDTTSRVFYGAGWRSAEFPFDSSDMACTFFSSVATLVWMLAVFHAEETWEQLRSLPLPGPELHHLITSVAVQVLGDTDGGTKYGMPETAVPWAHHTRDIHGAFEPSQVLNVWAGMVDVCCGPPWRQGFLGPAAMYTLCLRVARVCTAAVRSLDVSGEEPAGAGGAAGGDSTGSTDGGSEGGSTSSSSSCSSSSGAGGSVQLSLAKRRRDYPRAAVTVILAAHDALLESSRRQQARGAAGGVLDPGAAVLGVEEEEEEDAAAPSSTAAAAAAAGASTEADREESPHPVATSSPVHTATTTPTAEAPALEPLPLPPVAPAGQTVSTAAAAVAAVAGGCLHRPAEWWQAGAGALSSTILPSGSACLEAHEGEEGELVCQPELVGSLLEVQLKGGQLGQPLPGVLPSSPPPDLAGLLGADYLPTLERFIRDYHRGSDPGAAGRPVPLVRLSTNSPG